MSMQDHNRDGKAGQVPLVPKTLVDRDESVKFRCGELEYLTVRDAAPSHLNYCQYGMAGQESSDGTGNRFIKK